jgi:hypothetical protein
LRTREPEVASSPPSSSMFPCDVYGTSSHRWFRVPGDIAYDLDAGRGPPDMRIRPLIRTGFAE